MFRQTQKARADYVWQRAGLRRRTAPRGRLVIFPIIGLIAGTVGCSPAHSGAVSVPSAPVSTAIPTPTPTPTPTAMRSLSKSARTDLTSNLKSYLDDRPGQVSVEIRDRTTGITYGYNTGLRTATASIVKVDILVSLLLRAQQEDRHLTATERSLATQMIHASDNDAASALWDRIGGSSGLTAENKKLRLRNTTAGSGGAWGTTTTSVADQIRILRSLTSSDSPLSSASRKYVLGLMRGVESDQAWGVSAAADEGDTTALKNGWLPRTIDDNLWTINSIGRVRGDHHDYLIAVLSKRDATMEGGIATIEHVVKLVSEAVAKATSD
jgi:beta-lactamase class A